MKGSRRKQVEVVGIHLPNKGDELMLREIVNRLGAEHDLVASSDFDSDAWPADLALGRIPRSPTKSEFALERRGFPEQEMHRARLKHPVESKPAGVSTASVDVIVDCNGFSYSDQWGFNPSLIWRAGQYRACRGRGGKVIMLPQAYGPLEDKRLRTAVGDMVDSAHLVFARDERSLAWLHEYFGDRDQFHLAPDFTNLLPGRPPIDAGEWAERVCIVPNMRMLDKTVSGQTSAYVEFLGRCISVVRERGLSPCILVHEAKDHLINGPLLQTLGDELLVADHPALESKGILGACRAVISSRYHALIGALSQSVPTLGTAWTHKYHGLFDEYGCRECLVEDLSDAEAVAQQLDLSLEESHRADLVARLEVAAEAQRARTRVMWDRVQELLAR